MKAIILTTKTNNNGATKTLGVSDLMRTNTPWQYDLDVIANGAYAAQEHIDTVNSQKHNAVDSKKLVLVGIACHPTQANTFVALCDYRLK